MRVTIREDQRGWWHGDPCAEVISQGPFPTREECLADGRAYYDGEPFCIYEVGEFWHPPSSPSLDLDHFCDGLADCVEVDWDESEAQRRFDAFLQGLIDDGVLRYSSWQVEVPGELIEPVQEDSL